MDIKDFKFLRKTLGLTQVEMARLLNISHSSVTKYERETANPKGELNNKLDALMGLLNNDHSKKAILLLVKQEGGIAALSGLIGMHIASSESRDIKTEVKGNSETISSGRDLGINSSQAVIMTTAGAVACGTMTGSGVTGLSLLGPLGLAVGGAAFLLYKILGDCFNDTPEIQCEKVTEKRINLLKSSNINNGDQENSSFPKRKWSFRRKGVHRFKKSNYITSDKQ